MNTSEDGWVKGKIIIEMAPWEARSLIMDLYRHKTYRNFLVRYVQSEDPIQRLINALQEGLSDGYTLLWTEGKDKAERDIEAFKVAKGIED